jgi:hypothetical protein
MNEITTLKSLSPSKTIDLLNRPSVYSSIPQGIPTIVLANGIWVGCFFVSQKLPCADWSVQVAYYSQATVDGLLKVENIPQIARLRVPEGMFQPARAKRGHARNGDPASPTMVALARHRVSPVPIPFHSGSIGVSRPHSSPRAPYSHASSSSGTLGFSQAVDLHGYLGTQSLTSEPTERPPPLRRALTFTGENIQTRGPPETGISTGGSSPLEGGTRENSWPLPHISSSYPPSGEITDSRRILPFPAISRAVGVPRISTDDKALSALQTRFMK